MCFKHSKTKIQFYLITLLGLLMALNLTVSAQVTFTDVTEEAGLGEAPVRNAAYATWGDYDNDGDVDVFRFHITNGARRLYRNEGNGQFLNVTETVGITDSPSAGGPANFFDFDNDGALDLFLGGYGVISGREGDSLYRNRGDGTFLDISQSAGMESKMRTHFGALSFDFDNDGLLDIYVANGNFTSLPNFLYHNEGNGRFKEMAAQIGLDKPELAYGIALGDYDNDKDLDIFIGNAGPNGSGQGIDVLYRNEGNGRFQDVAQQAGVQRKSNHVNGLFWDYDNDGDLDLFVQVYWYQATDGVNTLYRNNGDGTFTDITQQAGIASVEVPSYGGAYGDYDSDGWLDLCVTYNNLPTLLYHNNQDGSFTEVGKASGIDGDNSGTTSFIDYDNDGDLDIFSGALYGKRVALYRNEGTTNHWLRLKLVGTKSNRDAIGTRIKVVSGNLKMLREVAGSSGGGSHQDRLPVHFGLGKNQKADVIEIRWPSGIVEVFKDVPANRVIQVKEGTGQYQVVSVQPRGKLPITLGQIKQTALLQNYPNPFNPETWIPFALDEEATVEIRIYDVAGKKVRTLNLGQKAKGEYQSKDKAAYWDGKNDAGEVISSGIYFYEMQAEDYTSVRKAMLLK